MDNYEKRQLNKAARNLENLYTIYNTRSALPVESAFEPEDLEYILSNLDKAEYALQNAYAKMKELAPDQPIKPKSENYGKAVRREIGDKFNYQGDQVTVIEDYGCSRLNEKYLRQHYRVSDSKGREEVLTTVLTR